MIGIAGIGKSRLAWEFYKYFDGLAEDVYWHRGAASPTAKASRTGRWPTWCGCAARIAEDEDPATALPKLRRDARASTCSTRTSGGASSRGWRSLLGLEERSGARPRGPVRRLAAVLRAAGRRRTRPSWCSRTCSGRTRACSTSSSTCWSGRASSRSSCSPSRAPSCSSSGRAGAPASATSPRSTSSRSRGGDGGAARRPRPGLCRRAARRRSWTAPRACRCTPWRRCGCCSTAACSSRRARSTGRPAPIEALDVPETLHGLIAARLDGLPAEERRLLQDAAVLGKTFTRAGARGARQD